MTTTKTDRPFPLGQPAFVSNVLERAAHLRTDLPVLRPDTPIVEALLLFYRERSTLPVVEAASGRLLGVLSYWDALSAITGNSSKDGQ